MVAPRFPRVARVAMTLRNAVAAASIGAAIVVSAGATYGWAGDGLVANGAGVGHGPNNPQEVLQMIMSGRIQPVAVPNLGKSGTRIKTSNPGSNQYAWVEPFAIDALAAQTPDIFLLGSMGHNDGVLSTDPATPGGPQADWQSAVSYGYAKFAAYGTGKLFIVVATVPSTITGESTWRSAVWAAQAAHVASIAATDSRVKFVSLTDMLPPSDYSSDTGSNYTHSDERGGWFVANKVKALLDQYVEAKTPDEIRDMIAAQTYPLMGSANLDSDEVLTGTGGARQSAITLADGTLTSRQPTANDTVSINGVTITFVASGATGNQVNIGASASATATNLNTFINSNLVALGLSSTSVSSNVVTITASGANVPAMAAGGATPPQVGQFIGGSIATSKTVLNSTGATGINSSQVSTSGGRTKTSIALSGTAASAGKVQIIDTSNVSISATRGQYAMTGAIVRFPPGVFNFGSDLNGGNYSLFGGGGQTIASNALVGAGTANQLAGLMMTTPFALFSGAYSSKRAFSAFYRSGSALSGTIEFERPYAYLVSERARHAAKYLGGVADANNAQLLGSNQRLRPTGTVSQAAGGTVTVEPGTWTPRGLTESDFGTRRIYKGTSGNTGVGTGTLIGTLTGSTWAKTFVAGDVTTGDLIYVEVDVSNGIGVAVTVRSTSTITAT